MLSFDTKDAYEWIGELFIENRLLKKELEKLSVELEQIKERLSENDSLSKQGEEGNDQE